MSSIWCGPSLYFLSETLGDDDDRVPVGGRGTGTAGERLVGGPGEVHCNVRASDRIDRGMRWNTCVCSCSQATLRPNNRGEEFRCRYRWQRRGGDAANGALPFSPMHSRTLMEEQELVFSG